MHSSADPVFVSSATDGYRAAARGDAGDVHAELNILKEIVRLLPAGITVQDEQGRFLLVNDAAAAQFRIPAEQILAVSSSVPRAIEALERRRNTCIEVLRTDRAAVSEECVGDGPLKRTWLTTHRPVRIADAKLLLTSSADLSEQKAVRSTRHNRRGGTARPGSPSAR